MNVKAWMAIIIGLLVAITVAVVDRNLMVHETTLILFNIFQLIYNAFGDGTDTGTEYKYKKMSVIKNEFKRRGVKYNSQDRFEGVRGYFMGLTKKEKEKDVLSL